jgi:hypothetical protein
MFCCVLVAVVMITDANSGLGLGHVSLTAAARAVSAPLVHLTPATHTVQTFDAISSVVLFALVMWQCHPRMLRDCS